VAAAVNYGRGFFVLVSPRREGGSGSGRRRTQPFAKYAAAAAEETSEAATAAFEAFI
jgi:hypothetical protein